MNLSGLPELLLAWFKNQGASLLQSDKQGQAAPFRPGAQYDAKVLDSLPNGRHLVQVAGQRMDMGLPRNTQPGDTLRLTYLSGDGRPTFLLNQTAAAPAAAPTQPVSLSSTAQQVTALMRIAGPLPMTTSVSGRGMPQTTASAPSPTPAGAALPGETQAIVTRASMVRSSQAMDVTALAKASVPVSAQIARASGRAVATVVPEAQLGNKPTGPVQTPATVSRPIASMEGMGKLAQPGLPATAAAMATGARPIAANVVMLQSYSATTQFAPGGAVSPNTALVGQAVDGLRAAIPSSTTLTPNVLAELPEPSRNLLPTRLHQTLSESGLFYESHLARWVKGEISFESILREPQARIGREALANALVPELGGMPDEVAKLAGKQLHLLEGAPFVWQGMAWPGQWMEWLVEERHEGNGEGEGADESVVRWVTEIRLDLPRMGAVHAHVGLSGDRVGLRLIARDEAVRSAMQAALPELAIGLEAAGLRPVSLTVDLPGEA